MGCNKIVEVTSVDFSLTEDQRAFQEMARGFATDRLAPGAAEGDAKKIFHKSK